jgi:para-nitrobenzyl esterase
MKKLCFTLITLLMTLTASAQEENKEVISTTSGLVSGIIQEGSLAYLGIPYAKVERFMPPKPVKKWKGIRKCDHWGPMTMQQQNRPMSEDQMSENCCVLNVWTTDVKAKKPVMFWLHGGGFDSGTSEWDPGMCLAKKDVVVVSINHRLNILGFLDLSTCGKKYKYSGNVGMLDAVQALEWVRDNIAKFGGDPNNVTIFGESGGGGKVGTLMCMPKAKGLFHKAIIMSGTILNVNTKAMTEKLGEAVLKELGLNKKTVDKIKDVSYKDLYAAGQRAMAASIGTRRPGTPMMWGFGPTPDGEVLLQQPFQPDFASISDDIPLMIGTTFNELQRSRYNQGITFEQARTELQKTFGDETEAYISALMEAYPDKQLRTLPSDLLCIDWLFRPKTIITADAIGGKRKADTYVYMYTVNEQDNRSDKGSAHGSELKYCFDVLHHYTNQLSQHCIDQNRKWATILSDVWAKFAHDGNPNCAGLPSWQSYTKENGELMEFGGAKPTLRHNHDRKLEEIINRHCFKLLDEFKPL